MCVMRRMAHILVKTVDEFKGMNPRACLKNHSSNLYAPFCGTFVPNSVVVARYDALIRDKSPTNCDAHLAESIFQTCSRDVVAYIEGEPFISTVPIDPGLTNTVMEKNGARIVGFNTENQELHEGIVRFDIIFYVRMRDGLSQIIINIEAQKDEPSEYDILNRAIFYVSRMISSQKERDFINSNYNDIKRVYSIWVCMNMPEDSLTHIHLVGDNIVNSHAWKGKMDLINIVMIGLAKTLPEGEEKYELHRLLGALLSQNLTANEKFDIIGNEYDIPLENGIREDVKTMCNLSQKIKETGIEIGIETGKREMIMKMHDKGYTIAQIADVAEMNEKQIEDIIKDAELLPV